MVWKEVMEQLCEVAGVESSEFKPVEFSLAQMKKLSATWLVNLFDMFG